ncbi:MAG TPA: hypothetical protein PLL75_02430 [Candidatus Omnitrophota bacterium]|nr:hypothetical protein [Candidatus Omnitrophota bacterium]HPS36569.1 hypothetical protein [Candidatus Omnitrophota bacterium]
MNVETTEKIQLSSGKCVEIGKCFLRLKPWTGITPRDTYGGKPVIDLDGKPSFPELAILRLWEADGWQGVWVDTYRRKFRPDLPAYREPISLPPAQQELFNAIKKKAGNFNGCWDVLVWDAQGQTRFIESRHRIGEVLKNIQLEWLEAAINLGIAPDCFRIVEWDFSE